MSEQAPRRKSKMTNVTYAERLTYYDTPDGMRLLQRVADARGLKATALLRTLVRDEARKLGIPVPEAKTVDEEAAE
jgi:hypothetical protein